MADIVLKDPPGIIKENPDGTLPGMIVILEGPDGSGKTTLARQLCDRYSLDYHHEGVPPADVPPLVHYGAVLDRYRFSRVVLDRLALGERIYGPLVRGTDRLGSDGWNVFQRLIWATGAIQVMCYPSYHVCYESWASGREELFSKKELFDKSYGAYAAFVNRQDFVYNYKDNEAWPRLCKRLENWKFNQLPSGVVGHPGAEILLVGDIGSNRNSPIDLPFFATVGSSEYLSRAIYETLLPDSRFAYVNSRRLVDGRPVDIRKITEAFPFLRKVVALGNTAASICLDQNVVCSLVPHPQYWKRFHHADVNGYTRLLEIAFK